jgi:hypothetical protein
MVREGDQQRDDLVEFSTPKRMYHHKMISFINLSMKVNKLLENNTANMKKNVRSSLKEW